MFKTDVFRQITSFEEAANLKNGDTVDRPYKSRLVAQDYTRGTAVTMNDITATSETMVVQTAKVVPFYVDDLDELQSNYKLQNEWADDAAKVLSNEIDGAILAAGTDAAAVNLSDSDLGGTSGNGIVASAANVLKIFTAAKRKLRGQNCPTDNLFAVISPAMEENLLSYIAGKESALGDSTGLGGHIGKWLGFDIYVSNALEWTAKLLVGTNVSEGDTVTINGVVFTFNATPSGAGSVDIGADAPGSIDNLVLAINGGAVGTAYIALSAADRILMKNITATDGTTYLTLKGVGTGYVAVSETLTAAADIWTAALQIEHCLFGRKKAIDAVIQTEPKIKVQDADKLLGNNILPYTLFGKKVFVEGTKQLVDVKLCSSAY